MGVNRVILSRELSLKEIEQIIAEVPDMEIEGICAWGTLYGVFGSLLALWLYQ